MSKKIINIILAFVVSLFPVFGITKNASAGASYFALSPMYQMVTLTPGEIFEGNFQITNPADATDYFYYELRVEPFTVDDENDISLTANGDYNQMVDWIELAETEGTVAPNTVKEIRFKINVPENAAAGGQYASIVVNSRPEENNNTNIDIQEVFEAAHLIYADVSGSTRRGGDITNINVPSFLFSGNISGSDQIKNNGNVHSQATHTLQIFPLFSKEEVYTNEETPKRTWVMPDNTKLTTVSWDETPSIGIFHVIYNVEFEGVESSVDKIVIVCPLWLLLLIIFIIILIAFKIIWGGKKEKK